MARVYEVLKKMIYKSLGGYYFLNKKNQIFCVKMVSYKQYFVFRSFIENYCDGPKMTSLKYHRCPSSNLRTRLAETLKDLLLSEKLFGHTKQKIKNRIIAKPIAFLCPFQCLKINDVVVTIIITIIYFTLTTFRQYSLGQNATQNILFIRRRFFTPCVFSTIK